MVEEAIAFAESYCGRISDWIREEHPSLMND